MKLKKIDQTSTLWELTDEKGPKGLAATMLTTDELLGIAKSLPPEILDQAGLSSSVKLNNATKLLGNFVFSNDIDSIQRLREEASKFLKKQQ